MVTTNTVLLKAHQESLNKQRVNLQACGEMVETVSREITGISGMDSARNRLGAARERIYAENLITAVFAGAVERIAQNYELCEQRNLDIFQDGIQHRAVIGATVNTFDRLRSVTKDFIIH